MTSGDIATVIIALITMATTLLTIVLQGSKNKKRVGDNSNKLDTIHVLVNSRVEEALKRIAELEAQIAAHQVPPTA